MPAASTSRELCLESSATGPEEATRTSETSLQMDEASFRRFYEQSAQRLFRYLLRVSGDRCLSEDLLQEAYCRFLSSKLPEMSDASQQNYLFRIATNLMRDRWRRHTESPLPENFSEPTSGLPQLDGQMDLRRAFQQLKVRERQLLWLAYVEGSDHREIAEATGLCYSSIRLLLFRARRRLADLIRTGTSSKRERSK